MEHLVDFADVLVQRERPFCAGGLSYTGGYLLAFNLSSDPAN